MGHKHIKNKKSRPGQEATKVLSLSGIIDIARSGMGFVAVEGLERDIVIYPENLNTALKGDKVKVDVMVRKTRDNKRVEGVVKEVLVRKQSEFLGRLDVKPTFAFLVPDNEKVPVDIFIPIDKLNGAKDGDKAMVRVTEWRRSKNPVGEVLRVLTQEDANEIAMQEILSENGFPLDFPDDVLEEAARIPDVLDKKEIARREDFRDVLTMTIDPIDAKDFDDAISLRTLKGGYYEVGVHIADVSHYLQPGGPLDEEALNRATSVYLPDRVLPMLPEHLSNMLCSLRPDEDKFTFSAIFTINKKGKVKDYRIAKTVIRSDRRFTYEEAQEIIETGEGDYAKEVLTLDAIAKALRAERFEHGAINFSSSEVRFRLDEQGKPIGIVVKESKDAHKLIEELMLLANRYVAGYAQEFTYKGKPLPFPYRIHDQPIEEKLSAFASFASKFGYRLNLQSPELIARSFNEMLKEVNGKPEQHMLESLGIRTMSKAIYTTENIGHYGLGFEHYCHFTSPIRRYPDVLVHRIVHDLLRGKVEPVKGLEEMCRHCSDQERNAMEAERTATKYKQVEYMQQFVGDVFEGVISGVTSFGVFVETIEHKCEGMLSVNDLSAIDRFDFSESEYALVGRYTGIRFTIGQHLMIRVVRTDLDKRQIDFELAEMPAQKVARRIAKGKDRQQEQKKKRKK
ncbi:ribonuclease R [Rurimicrobium arvi]|uniref:Ribonuclease R n=1 Tax=Rurimicrobium arvi TaxID=2049916 RepID=A0ABP8MY32_9BACT